MVSIYKMGKSYYRLLQLILLCLFWESSFASPGWIEHRSMDVHEEDVGEIILFIVSVIITIIAKKLDKGYKCPVYCEVNHKHYYWEIDEDKENNLQTTHELH
jgi:hypothetical protein